MVDMWSEGYIGMSTISARARWNAHRHSAKLECKSHLPIYRAFIKYGEDSLVMQVICAGPDDYITDLESKLRPTEGVGWNCAMGGQDPGKGRTHSPEERARRSVAGTGRKHSEESKRRMSLATTGKPKSQAHKEKCRVAALGKKRPQSAIDAQRIKVTGQKIHSEDFKLKMSVLQKSLQPWERSRSDAIVWANADAVRVALADSPPTMRKISKLLNVVDSKTRKLCELLKDGWNPLTDAKWLEWMCDKTKSMQINKGFYESTPIN